MLYNETYHFFIISALASFGENMTIRCTFQRIERQQTKKDYILARKLIFCAIFTKVNLN